MEIALELARDGRVVRTSGFRAAGIHPMTLFRLVESGHLRQIRTLNEILVGYQSTAFPEPVHREDELWEIAIRHPQAVLCLHSAARYHDLTDNTSNLGTAAVSPGSNRRPSLDIRLVRWSNPDMFRVGVETVELAPGIEVRITDIPRTLADMFRDRRRVTDEERQHALGQVANRLGEEGIQQAADYASKLGWGERMTGVVMGAKGTMKWTATRMP
jgi:hypothetical protein